MSYLDTVIPSDAKSERRVLVKAHGATVQSCPMEGGCNHGKFHETSSNLAQNDTTTY